MLPLTCSCALNLVPCHDPQSVSMSSGYMKTSCRCPGSGLDAEALQSSQPRVAMTVSAVAATGSVTPTDVADNVLRCIADSEAAQPPMRLFASVDEADVRRQAAESTARQGSRSASPFYQLTCTSLQDA